MTDFQLAINPAGQLVFTAADGSVSVGVVPVRAFPVSAPDDGLSLVGADGHELAWIAKLTTLPAAQQSLLQAALAQLEFMPGITRLLGVSGFATPSTWTVQTDRGDTQFVLKAEDDIRRLGFNRLMIADRHGVHYLIRDLAALDKHSRKLLDRFL
jgi:hypothetical protein